MSASFTRNEGISARKSYNEAEVATAVWQCLLYVCVYMYMHAITNVLNLGLCLLFYMRHNKNKLIMCPE